MYFYPWGTHISWSTPSALLLTPYSVGCFHPRTSFFTESPVIFIICHPKTLFFVLKHPKFSNTCHQKTPLKTPSFLSRKDHFFSFFFLSFFFSTLSPKDPYFLNAWCTSLYTNRFPPGYLHPLSILSQSTSVSPTEVLSRSITTERYAPSRLHAKPSASTILAYA